MKRLKKNPDDDDDLARHPDSDIHTVLVDPDRKLGVQPDEADGDHCGLSDGCFGSIFSVCGSQ
jgi:hypothetical protein